jgi:hypothetical protein
LRQSRGSDANKGGKSERGESGFQKNSRAFGPVFCRTLIFMNVGTGITPGGSKSKKRLKIPKKSTVPVVVASELQKWRRV